MPRSSESPRTTSVTDLATWEKNTRRLAGRVGAADDVDVGVDAVGGLGGRGAVVEAAAGEVGDARARRGRGRTRRSRRSRRGPATSVPSPNATTRAEPCGSQPDDVAGGEDLGAELRSPAGAPGRSAGRRRPRRGSRGSSRSASDWPACPPVACRSTSRVRRPSDGAVDGRAQPGRPGADDDEVVEVGRRRRRQPDRRGDLGGRGRDQRLARPGVTTSGKPLRRRPRRPRSSRRPRARRR